MRHRTLVPLLLLSLFVAQYVHTLHLFIVLKGCSTFMLLDISCKQGRLQMLEDGTLRVVSGFLKRLMWSTPHSHVRRLAVKSDFFSCSVIFTTSHGAYHADGVGKHHVPQLQQLFPNCEIATKASAKSHKPAKRQSSSLMGTLLTSQQQDINVFGDPVKKSGRAAKTPRVPKTTSSAPKSEHRKR